MRIKNWRSFFVCKFVYKRQQVDKASIKSDIFEALQYDIYFVRKDDELSYYNIGVSFVI